MAPDIRLLAASALTFLQCACSGEGPPASDAGACAPSGEYEFVCGTPNAEDLVALPNSPWVLASAMAPDEAIRLIDSRSREAVAAWPSPTARAAFDATRFAICPGAPDLTDFFTHGLHLRRTDNGELTLYAVSHGAREAIEAFDIDMSAEIPTLTWIGCVPMPAGLEANSVTSAPDGALLATVPIHPGSTFEQAMAGEPTGAVYQWSPGDAGFTIIIGTELPASNGIEVSADGTEIYVASSGLRTVVAYDRGDPARLLRTTEPMPIVPDNVRLRPDGSLVTAGTIVDAPECAAQSEAAEFDIEAFAACPRGFMALAIDPATMHFATLAQGAANSAFSNATMAVEIGDELWVGTFAGDRIGIVSADR